MSQYTKYIPDSVSMIDSFNTITEYGYNLYNIDREIAIQVKLDSFMQNIGNINTSYLRTMASGDNFNGFSGSNFSSGEGRFSGGGGRGAF